MKSTKFHENTIYDNWNGTLLAMIRRFWNFDVEVYYFTELPIYESVQSPVVCTISTHWLKVTCALLALKNQFFYFGPKMFFRLCRNMIQYTKTEKKKKKYKNYHFPSPMHVYWLSVTMATDCISSNLPI